jgi:prepilin-type N-terminal cleavage/methylation domain-containing protein
MIGKHSRGFTLVELSLVMAFLSLLLLAILFSTIHIGKLYAKGVTNRQINQVGRELVDTVRRDFLVADAASIDISALANNRICLGGVSYVWNTAAVLASGASSSIVKDGTASIVFTRIEDPAISICARDVNGKYLMDIALMSNTSELLASDGRSLVLYDMSVVELMRHDSDGLYRVKMTIGTNDISAMRTDGAAQCRPPTDSSSDFEYCGVAEFDIIVRVGGDSR